MIIKVLQKHIDQGWRGSTVQCPIALAINEQLKPYPTALACWSKPGAVIKFGESCFISKQAQIFMERFDAGEPVQPFELKLRQSRVVQR